MNGKATAYRSYLLRVWRVDNEGRPVSRFTLQPTDGGPVEIFNNTAELLSFLGDGGRKKAARRPPATDDR